MLIDGLGPQVLQKYHTSYKNFGNITNKRPCTIWQESLAGIKLGKNEWSVVRQTQTFRYSYIAIASYQSNPKTAKKCAAPLRKRCEIKGGGQEMDVMVGH